MGKRMRGKVVSKIRQNRLYSVHLVREALRHKVVEVYAFNALSAGLKALRDDDGEWPNECSAEVTVESVTRKLRGGKTDDHTDG